MQVYASAAHTASVNSISFAPHELGLILASASSDGSIGVFSQQDDGTFVEEKVCLLKSLLTKHEAWDEPYV